MRDDFAVLILSHGRPDLVAITIKALTKARYTGRWFIVLDTDDGTRDEYAARWGEERIITFDKDEVAQTFDLADNGGPRGVIVYARNAAEKIAADLGLTYYMQLDDDYTYFAHRFQAGNSLGYAYTFRLDEVLEAFIEFLDASGALTVAFAQGGDYIGGIAGSWRTRTKRKAMNTFITRVGRPVRFTGRINEDVNAYVWRGTQGELFITSLDFAIDQKDTQTQGGGMTGAYLDGGTYAKSFYTVMHAPSCVKIATLGETAQRFHHRVRWPKAVPKIVPARVTKPGVTAP